MNKMFIILVTFMCISLKVSAVTYNLKNSDWEADQEDEKRMDVSYNGLQLHKEQYPMNRIMVTGVIMDKEKPSESKFILIDPAMIMNEEEADNSEREKDMSRMELPIFEVEYGREPLEYLISMLSSKMGLETKVNSSIGMANAYGFSLKSSGSTYLGSKMADYNKDADSVDSLSGPLLGTYLTTIYNEDPKAILQTKDESTQEWDNHGMDAIPALNIVYMLNMNEDWPEGDEEFEKFGAVQAFQDVAKNSVEHAKTNDSFFVISRAMFMENAINGANLFEQLKDDLRRVLV